MMICLVSRSMECEYRSFENALAKYTTKRSMTN